MSPASPRGHQTEPIPSRLPNLRPRLLAALLFMALLLGGCKAATPPTAGETDPAFRLDMEQVRFDRRGIYPFDPLIGRAYVRAEKPLIVNRTWYPDPEQTSVRIFEDGVERPVLRIHTWPYADEQLNLMVMVPVTRGIAVGAGGGTSFNPQLVKTLEHLAQGYKDHLYNLAILFCWGESERRYPFLSEKNVEEFVIDFKQLTYPGPAEGSFMNCLEGGLADLDWLQRATPEEAEAATLRRGTFPLFFKQQQNRRTQVLLLTDGVPFREGPLDTFSDLLVRGNFPLYAVGLAASTEGERGLRRLEELYDRRRLAGSFTLIPGHEQLSGTVQGLIDGWLSSARSFMVEYLSGYSGVRGTEVPVWVAWRNGKYTSREVRITPGAYQTALRWFLRSVVLLGMLGGFLLVLRRFHIWPFREEVQVIPCPGGCGHMIPRTWYECRFCRIQQTWGRLVLLNGDQAGTVFYLKEDYYTLGSDTGDDLQLTHLKDYQVNPAHVTLQRLQAGEKIVLQFDGARVRVAGRTLTQGSVSLRFGDIIELGELNLAAILLRGVERIS